ncbi:hypothetical protein L195_g012354 [Trifolium pratense]|uniref:TF-B3 domain-containing protein n=1 Tax=Trifolium pratense TaxID=57577 RepID=A0A2K3PK38_TRIPR|nr:hypothetical protein L195_g012354 [Trifolium pratense]
MTLTSGSSVSKSFGFLKPTRVTLSYVPADNKFWMRILPDKKPSNETTVVQNMTTSMPSTFPRVPTAEDIAKYRTFFHTVIDPNTENINILDDFYEKRKTSFETQKFGWIRGPQYKNASVFYHKTNTGMTLTSGESVSKSFGFLKPTRVTLSYVPADNKFWMRILPDTKATNERIGDLNIHSSIQASFPRVPTAEDIADYTNFFDTVIDPKMENINIPDDFYEKWKTSFEKHKFGWIRVPNYKSTAVFYHTTNTGMNLTSGLSVSKSFGFLKPTRVKLSYVPGDNKFLMRILPDTKPSNETTAEQNLATSPNIPNSLVGSQDLTKEINTAESNSDQTIPMSASAPNSELEIEKSKITQKRKPNNEENLIDDNIHQSHLRRSKRLMLSNKTMKSEELTKVKPKLPSKGEQHQKRTKSSNKAFNGRINIKKTEAGYEWDTVVTEAMSRKIGSKVLHILREIARVVLNPKVTNILVQIQINGVTFMIIPCNIMATKRNKFERYISKEWSRIVKTTNLKTGDKLIFKLDKPPSTLIIQLLNVKGQK